MPDTQPIVVIQSDAHFHAWMGCKNPAGPRTPNLDALGKQGVVFDQAYTCSGICMPARVSMLSGRYPISHGVVTNEVAARPSTEPHVAAMLQDQGYTTGLFGRTHFGGDDHLDADGWDNWFVRGDYKAYLDALPDVHATYPEKGDINGFGLRYWNAGGSRIPNEHYYENVVTDRAVRFIENNARHNFFCYLNYLAPHGPFTPPAPYDRMYDPASLELMPRFEGELEGKPAATQRWIRQNQRYLNDQELHKWLAAVYGLVTMVDDNVGKVLHALEKQGLREQALIVFLADHGDYATRHGILGKSWSMQDELTRIPMIVSMPGSRHVAQTDDQGVRWSDALVQNIDVTATALDWAGVTLPRHVQGKSLTPLLRGEIDAIRDEAYCFNTFEYSRDRLCMSMLRSGQWKYVESSGMHGELYDLINDPYETRNLAQDPGHEARCHDLRRRLLQWQIDHVGQYFDPRHASFWEDVTFFYDENRFTGERQITRISDEAGAASDPNQP